MRKRNFVRWTNNRAMAHLPATNGRDNRSLWGSRFGKKGIKSAKESTKSHGVVIGNFDPEAPMDGMISFTVTQTPNITIVEAVLNYDCFSPYYSLDGLTTFGEARRSPTDEFDPTAGFELALSRALKEMKIIVGASANTRIREASEERANQIDSQEEAASNARRRRLLTRSKNRHPSLRYTVRNNGKVNA